MIYGKITMPPDTGNGIYCNEKILNDCVKTCKPNWHFDGSQGVFSHEDAIILTSIHVVEIDKDTYDMLTLEYINTRPPAEVLGE